MAKLSRREKAEARFNKWQQIKSQGQVLQEAIDNAETPEERLLAEQAQREWQDAQTREDEKRFELEHARQEARKARREDDLPKQKLEWVDGAGGLIREVKKRRQEVNATQVGAEGNLVTCRRDVDRWELEHPYDSVRGVRAGELLMVVSEQYESKIRSGRFHVDVMASGQVIRGVPVAALRPVD